MITITVLDRENKYKIICEEGQSIMQALLAYDQGISAFCGGNGICGKCKICLTEGELPVSLEDRAAFTEEEVKEGYRLACMAYPKEDCTIRLFMEKEQKMEVVTETADSIGDTAVQKKSAAGNYGIAVDIGTTTVAMQLCEEGSLDAIATYTALNPQRSYGADVISRIHAANSGEEANLKKKICETLKEGFRCLLTGENITSGKVKEVVISANTTMAHLLLGYPCKTLGAAPYTPYNIKPDSMKIRELIDDTSLSCEVKIVPGISAFVGGDIVAGLDFCGILKQEKPVLFIDLGTNGEMALGNREKLFVTSVAAGPAFEGGNIACGVGSIPGAIYSVQMRNGKVAKIDTIGEKAPIGICGTGVIEAVAELLKEKLLDKSGLLCDELFERGMVLSDAVEKHPVVLTQKDVREIQLAKSAVRSGVEVLLKRYGIGYQEIEKVYLAGGFGYYANPEKMARIGMLPEELKEKVTAVGNSSLGGARKVLFDSEGWERLDRIAGLGEEISLAMDDEFQRLYMEYLSF